MKALLLGAGLIALGYTGLNVATQKVQDAPQRAQQQVRDKISLPVEIPYASIRLEPRPLSGTSKEFRTIDEIVNNTAAQFLKGNRYDPNLFRTLEKALETKGHVLKPSADVDFYQTLSTYYDKNDSALIVQAVLDGDSWTIVVLTGPVTEKYSFSADLPYGIAVRDIPVSLLDASSLEGTPLDGRIGFANGNGIVIQRGALEKHVQKKI